MKASELKIKIFSDGADLPVMKELAANPLVKGFTTNPSLMRKAGVKDYSAYAKEVLGIIGGRPISFEVFADDFPTMEKQALKIATWAPNVNVKIPVINTNGEFTGPLIERLSAQGVHLNVTLLFTVEQVKKVVKVLSPQAPAYISLFAGRAADVGIDPIPLVRESLKLMQEKPKTEMIWASTREPFNAVEADREGAHIITMPPDMVKKLSHFGKSLEQCTLEGIKAFYDDTMASGFTIEA